MKKAKSGSTQNQLKERKYFNPYDHYEQETFDHTYRRTSTLQRSQSKTTNLEHSRRKKIAGKTATVIPVQSVPRKKAASKTTKTMSNRLNNVNKQTAARRQQPVYRSASQQSANRTTQRLKLAKSRKLTKRQHLLLRRRRRLRLAVRTFLAMAVTIGMIWGIFFMKDYLTKTTISTQLVQVGTLDTSSTLEGVVMRSEKVIYGQEDGTVQYLVAEGEKVKKDGSVYVLVDKDKLGATTNQIEDVESEIYHKAENNQETADNLDEKYNLAQDIKSNFNDYYNNCFESSTSYVYALRSKLDSNVSSRTDLYVAQQKGKDDQLIAQKQQLDKELEGYQKGKTADISGIVSFHMDGYETEDINKALQEMNYDTYNKLKKVTTNNQLGQSTISKDAPLYKLVLNNNWYIVSYISEKEDCYTQGNMYKLFFSSLGDKAIQFTLVEKKEEQGKIRLLFKSSNQIGDFLSTRGVTFSIGDKDVTGLKIPISAVVEQNYIKIPMEYTVTDQQTIGVYRKKGEVIEFVALDVQNIDQDDKCYDVLQDLTDSGKIKLNDTLVNQEDGSTYQVTQSIIKKGVYVVNGKIASFKEIDIIDQSNEYAIVRYNNNSKLKEMDKIISNPKSVKMDQLVDQMKIQNE